MELKTYQYTKTIEAIKWDGSQEMATFLFEEGCPVIHSFASDRGQLWLTQYGDKTRPVQANIGDMICRDEYGRWFRYRNYNDFEKEYTEVLDIPT